MERTKSAVNRPVIFQKEYENRKRCRNFGYAELTFRSETKEKGFFFVFLSLIP
jgi:hypothetical protein